MVKHYISTDVLGMQLRQMGASSVHINSSKIIFVEFDINENLRISYFCNIRDEGKIYIQRIEPYPIRNYGFENVENILEFIENDVKLFANASKSSNFPLFLEIINTNYFARKEMEKLFLLNNVPHGLLEDLLESAQNMLREIISAEHKGLDEDEVDLSEEYTDILEEAAVITVEHGIDGFGSTNNIMIESYEKIIKNDN